MTIQPAGPTPDNITPLTAPTPESILASLVRDRVDLAATIEALQARLAEIDARILDQLDVGSHNVDGATVQIREYVRTDTAALAKSYPADQYPALYVTKTTIDPAAVKKAFAPAALEPYKVHGKKSVVVKP